MGGGYVQAVGGLVGGFYFIVPLVSAVSHKNGTL